MSLRIKPNQHAGLIKSKEEISIMREAGRRLAVVREQLVGMVRPGLSTEDLDRAAREAIQAGGDEPAFLGYRGYPATICASINEEVVHGIPSPRRRLKEGDVLSVDMGLIHRGLYADTAVSVAVGRVDPDLEHLIEVTRRALEVGIEAAKPGCRVGDISSAIETWVTSQGLQVVREYTGHGIGREMHQEPMVPNYGPAGKGLRLREGMTLALEPMVNLGTWSTEVLDDDWTVVTADRRPSAHFEHTIALTQDGATILTTE